MKKEQIKKGIKVIHKKERKEIIEVVHVYDGGFIGKCGKTEKPYSPISDYTAYSPFESFKTFIIQSISANGIPFQRVQRYMSIEDAKKDFAGLEVDIYEIKQIIEVK